MEINSFTYPNRFLSNYHLCPVTVDGITYPSSEHAYMAQKSDQYVEVIDLETRSSKMVHWKMRCQDKNVPPATIKRESRNVTLVPGWDENRLATMEKVLRAKFKNDAEMNMLLDTGDATLIEGNNWNDTYWGMCNGVGENHLGKILMKIREDIRDEMRKAS